MSSTARKRRYAHAKQDSLGHPRPSGMMSIPILRALANAILAGEHEADAIASRLRHAAGSNARWIRPLAKRYTQQFSEPQAPRRRDVVAFLRDDPGLQEATRLRPLRLSQWITGTQPMRPAPAAAGWPVPSITSVGALAQWLRVSHEELHWFADLKQLGAKQQQPRLEHYHVRALEKSTGGVRLIESPKPRLKSLQRRILQGILNHIPPHPAAHGFVKARSIRSFAAPHVNQPVVLRMDLTDFFPSFPRARIQSFFRTAGYPEAVADLLGGLTTHAVSKREWASLPSMYTRPHLPQGAPTSPALANLCSYRLDCRLFGLVQAAGGVYTRYADDLAFSGDLAFKIGIDRFSTLVSVIVGEEGWMVNHHKTRTMRASARQRVAGVVINQRLNVTRADFDRLKAILTNCVRSSPAEQNREGHPHFREHLAGRISFVESIHPERGKRLRGLFSEIVWS